MGIYLSSCLVSLFDPPPFAAELHRAMWQQMGGAETSAIENGLQIFEEVNVDTCS